MLWCAMVCCSLGAVPCCLGVCLSVLWCVCCAVPCCSEGAAIVWLSKQPTAAYWQWVQMSPAPLVTVTTAVPPWPWIAIAPAAVAKFKYPAECVAHRCPRNPYKGALYYSLSTVGTLLAELQPSPEDPPPRAPRGPRPNLAPHGLATGPPQVLAPNTAQGIWFHDLPALATLRGTIAAVDAGTTPAGMTMAGVGQSGLGAY